MLKKHQLMTRTDYITDTAAVHNIAALAKRKQ